MTAIRPPTDADGNLSLILNQRNEVISAGSSNASVAKDANVLVITPAVIDTAWDISVGAVHLGRQIRRVALSCSATGQITNNRLMRLSDGSCTITAKSGLFIKSQTVSMLRQGGQTFNQWQSWVAGSLAASIEQTTDISIPFWRGSGFGFTAITPCHVIGCEHINFMPPTLTLEGVTRNLVSSAIVAPANSVDNWKSDLMVGRYDGDFPSYAKVLPSNLYTKMPNLMLKGVPVVVCNQFGQKIQRLTGTISESTSKMGLTKLNSTDPDIIGGDSGNPAFIVINNEPVLLGTLTHGGTGGLTTIHDQISAINTAISSLGGKHYQLTEFNLSAYPTY